MVFFPFSMLFLGDHISSDVERSSRVFYVLYVLYDDTVCTYSRQYLSYVRTYVRAPPDHDGRLHFSNDSTNTLAKRSKDMFGEKDFQRRERKISAYGRSHIAKPNNVGRC